MARDEAGEMWRLFIAAYPPIETARAMLGTLRTQRLAPHRIVPAEQVHMTVLFLGRRVEGEVDGILERVRAVAARTGGVALTPRRLMTLPARGPARLVALECDATPNLHVLYERLAGALTGPDDRTVRKTLLPHFTLCRFGRNAGMRRVDVPVVVSAFEVGEIALVRSVLGPQGATHSLVGSTALE